MHSHTQLLGLPKCSLQLEHYPQQLGILFSSHMIFHTKAVLTSFWAVAMNLFCQ